MCANDPCHMDSHSSGVQAAITSVAWTHEVLELEDENSDTEHARHLHFFRQFTMSLCDDRTVTPRRQPPLSSRPLYHHRSQGTLFTQHSANTTPESLYKIILSNRFCFLSRQNHHHHDPKDQHAHQIHLHRSRWNVGDPLHLPGCRDADLDDLPRLREAPFRFPGQACWGTS